MTELAKLEANVKARNAASDAWELVNELASELSDEPTDNGESQQDRFFWMILMLAGDRVPGVLANMVETSRVEVQKRRTRRIAMNDAEAEIFAIQYWPRGMYTSCTVGDIAASDRGYAEHWAEGDEFTQELRRYMRWLVQKEMKDDG
jgi:hypothetical protein